MSSPDDELGGLDACGQADWLQRRQVKATELAAAAIARIEVGNPAINAVIAPLFDRAMRQAEAVDTAGVTADRPLAGVPMLMKDAGEELTGTPHWVGTPVLHHLGHCSTATTPLAARFEAAGLVILGKTNLPELSAGATTEPEEFGPTRNPFDASRTVGGSSGGSAAAVAAGFVAVAHGSDGTGSLRFPASACGVFTLKPSRGRVPSIAAAGAVDDLQLWAEFVLTRTARDLRAFFALLADDARPAPTPQPLRVGLLAEDVAAGLPTDPACVAAVERTGAALESLGHVVEWAHPPGLDGLFGRVAPAFATAGAYARASQVRWVESRIGRPVTEGDLSASTLELAAKGAAVTPDQAAAASAQLSAAMQPIPGWWTTHDLLVTPTMRMPPWLIGTQAEAFLVGGFAFPSSFTGQPALNLPAHRTAEGLPIGVQLVARAGADELLLRLAAELEAGLLASQG